MERWGEARVEPEGHLNPEVRGQERLLKLLLPKPGPRQVASSRMDRNIYFILACRPATTRWSQNKCFKR